VNEGEKPAKEVMSKSKQEAAKRKHEEEEAEKVCAQVKYLQPISSFIAPTQLTCGFVWARYMSPHMVCEAHT
jgi:hypothetical protein